MNKYVYAEATQDYWPQIKTIMAKSYNEAVEKIIEKYTDEFPDENFSNVDNWEDLQDLLNDRCGIDLSDLEDYEEL